MFINMTEGGDFRCIRKFQSWSENRGSAGLALETKFSTIPYLSGTYWVDASRIKLCKRVNEFMRIKVYSSYEDCKIPEHEPDTCD